jgi:Ca-activated chloride channel homolog
LYTTKFTAETQFTTFNGTSFADNFPSQYNRQHSISFGTRDYGFPAINMARSIRTILFSYCWLAMLILGFVTLSLESFHCANAQQTKPRQVYEQDPKNGDMDTIRLGTQLVNVLFSVTDKENRYVKDLDKSDVSILENGKPQVIFTFKRELDLPLTMAILVDVSNSVLPVLPRLTDASARFIDSVMQPGKDRTAIIQFNSETRLIQDLTSNVTQLRRGLREIVDNAPRVERVYRSLPPVIIGGSALGGTSIYDSIIATCTDLLANNTGRKTIILFTDGKDTTSRSRRSDAIEEALRGETVIYAIGVGDPEAEGVKKGELNKMCELTGGRAFIPRDVEDLDRAFTQLEQELRQQYLLAYEPISDKADGSFRKIEVRVPNRKGILIRHRRGYYALEK